VCYSSTPPWPFDRALEAELEMHKAELAAAKAELAAELDRRQSIAMGARSAQQETRPSAAWLIIRRLPELRAEMADAAAQLAGARTGAAPSSISSAQPDWDGASGAGSGGEPTAGVETAIPAVRVGDVLAPIVRVLGRT
jgi:type IV secretory pathway TrbL component